MGGDWRCHAWLRTHCKREISFDEHLHDYLVHFQDMFLWLTTMFDWLLSHRQDPAVSIGRQMLLKENRSAMMKLMKDLEQTATKITDYDQTIIDLDIWPLGARYNKIVKEFNLSKKNLSSKERIKNNFLVKIIDRTRVKISSYLIYCWRWWRWWWG